MPLAERGVTKLPRKPRLEDETMGEYEKRKKFTVFGSDEHDNCDLRTYNEVASAAQAFFRMHRRFPLGTYVSALSKDADLLMEWSRENKAKIQEWMERYDYDGWSWGFWSDRIDGWSGADEKMDEFGGDQVGPYSVG